jgi:hypothetical protein
MLDLVRSSSAVQRDRCAATSSAGSSIPVFFATAASREAGSPGSGERPASARKKEPRRSASEIDDAHQPSS